MCGIVGFTGKPNSELLKQMTDSIHHRGPDESAYIVNSNFSIGYRRLAIIDMTPGMYPIEDAEKSLELVLNGEIYNYQSLRKELEADGYIFTTHSDSETILYGYKKWGTNVVNHLRGMFVFVLLDKEKNELFIARDRLGIKPLYYSKKSGHLIFSSEIKAIFSGFDVSREPDDRSVYNFLLKRVHDIDENTFFKSVKRLLPGHFMQIKENGDFSIKKYWNPVFNSKFNSKKTDDEYSNEFKELFSEAVKLHLLADVPVGVTLSGGLDSSGITSLSQKLFNEAMTLDQSKDTKGQLIAFSAVHPGEKQDESEYISSVVESVGIESVKIQPQVEKFWEDFDLWLYFQEEPTISTAPYAYFTVMREARKQVTVLLSGQGGDELFGGYLPYFKTYLQSAMAGGKYFKAAYEIFRGNDLYIDFFKSLLDQKLNRTQYINPKACITSTNDYKAPDLQYSKNLNERLFKDVTSLTTPCLLRYEDKNSMANSLESRVPFFDHKVVEYIFNLPIDQKIKHGWTRYVYRNAMKGIIPEKNRLRRSKVGFVNPEWEWIERKSDEFKQVFTSETFKARKYWDADEIHNQFDKTLKEELDGDGLFFWRVFIVEMWMRKYVDNFEVI